MYVRTYVCMYVGRKMYIIHPYADPFCICYSLCCTLSLYKGRYKVSSDSDPPPHAPKVLCHEWTDVGVLDYSPQTKRYLVQRIVGKQEIQ